MSCDRAFVDKYFILDPSHVIALAGGLVNSRRMLTPSSDEGTVVRGGGNAPWAMGVNWDGCTVRRCSNDRSCSGRLGVLVRAEQVYTPLFGCIPKDDLFSHGILSLAAIHGWKPYAFGFLWYSSVLRR